MTILPANLVMHVTRASQNLDDLDSLLRLTDMVALDLDDPACGRCRRVRHRSTPLEWGDRNGRRCAAPRHRWKRGIRVRLFRVVRSALDRAFQEREHAGAVSVRMALERPRVRRVGHVPQRRAFADPPAARATPSRFLSSRSERACRCRVSHLLAVRIGAGRVSRSRSSPHPNAWNSPMPDATRSRCWRQPIGRCPRGSPDRTSARGVSRASPTRRSSRHAPSTSATTPAVRWRRCAV